MVGLIQSFARLVEVMVLESFCYSCKGYSWELDPNVVRLRHKTALVTNWLLDSKSSFRFAERHWSFKLCGSHIVPRTLPLVLNTIFYKVHQQS